MLTGKQAEEGRGGGDEVGQREPAGLARDGVCEEQIANKDKPQLGHCQHGAHGAEVGIIGRDA